MSTSTSGSTSAVAPPCSSPPDKGYAFTRAYVEKPAGTLGTDLQSITLIGKAYRPLAYDQARYRAAATVWSKQRPEQLG